MSTTETDTRLSERLDAAFPGFELPAELLRIAEVAARIDPDTPLHSWDLASENGIDHELLIKVGSVLYRPGDAAYLRHVCEVNGWDLGEPEPAEELDQVPDEVPEEYELSADELAAWEALEPSPVPEPSPEPTKPVRSRSAAPKDVAEPPADSGWRWNPADPIGSRQAWCSALIPCKAVDTGPKVLAWLLSEKADTRTGIVYLTPKTIKEEFGRSRSVAEGYRAELRDAGFLVEAGWNDRGVKLWRLAIPACDCGKH